MRVPTTGVDDFNALPQQEARARLISCLAVPRWVEEVLGSRPYDDERALLARAADAAAQLTEPELDAALAGHPRIGERAGNGHSAAFSSREQSGVDPEQGDVRQRLLEGNRAYEQRFGRVFLIRAAGRGAEEILAELERRLGNDDAREREETVRNLREIALLRLEQILAPR